MIKMPRCQMRPQEGKHFYDTDFGLFPSVTTILGATQTKEKADVLKNWRIRKGDAVADHILETTSGIGTAAHLFNEKYQARKHGLPYPLDKFDEQYALFGHAHHVNCRPFLDSVEEVYALEQAVFSSELKLAGTIDCVGKVDGKICVIDYKTKGKPQKQEWMYDYFLQSSLYAEMWNLHVSEKYHAAGIIIVASSEFKTLQTF